VGIEWREVTNRGVTVLKHKHKLSTLVNHENIMIGFGKIKKILKRVVGEGKF